MFTLRMTSADDTGQAWVLASSGSGGSRLGRASSARHAEMLSSDSGSMSVGCQVRAGKARAKKTACWPVPLATSSTVPDVGSTSRRTASRGSRLRSVAWA